MDVTGIATLATQMSQAKTTNTVQMAVLKKALDIQAQGAMQLLEAATSGGTPTPSHLGNSVDTYA